MKVFFIDRELFIANDDTQIDKYFEKIYSRPRNLQHNEDIVEVENTDKDTIFVTNKYSNEVEEMVYESLLLQGYVPKTMFHDFDEKKENPLECIEVSISILISIINDKIKLPCRICRSINYHLNMFEYDSI